MVKHWGLTKPEIASGIAAGQDCVIVDTNNPAELPEGINDANVLAIIDHHMLVGGLKTKSPIDITIRPLACTATVMHDLMGDAVAKAPKAIRGAMLSCIVSDTLAFRSPTTTPHDKAVAEKLARDLGVSIPDLADAMFAAKSDVSAFSDAELLRMDSKEYTVAGKDLRVSVLETTVPQGRPRPQGLADDVDGSRGEGRRRRSGPAVRRRHNPRRGNAAGAKRSGQAHGRGVVRRDSHRRHGRAAGRDEPQEADPARAETLTAAIQRMAQCHTLAGSMLAPL